MEDDMSKHTPGPWIVKGYIRPVKCEDGTVAQLYCADVYPRMPIGKFRGSICYVQSADKIGGIDNSEAEANAHLIAAAQELLEALEELAFRAERHGMNADDASAAIAKARGEG
jgi:hypothetical protein